VAYGLTPEGHSAINLYGPGEATLPSPAAGALRLQQATRYPFAGDIRITVHPEKVALHTILLRVPGWADQAVFTVNGAPANVSAQPDRYAALDRAWQPGDVITIQFPMRPRVHRRTNRNVQESRAPDGTPISQEVLHFDYAAVTRGPLVYASGLIDGFKIEETIRLPGNAEAALEVTEPSPGSEAPDILLKLDYRPPLRFSPYFEAGGRTDGAWRLTWLQIAPA